MPFGSVKPAFVVVPKDAPNTDGIDLDCVQNAVVEYSYFDVGGELNPRFKQHHYASVMTQCTELTRLSRRHLTDDALCVKRYLV